jgi:hypothetical protein
MSPMRTCDAQSDGRQLRAQIHVPAKKCGFRSAFKGEAGRARAGDALSSGTGRAAE